MRKITFLIISTLIFNLIQSQEPSVMWELVYEPENSMGRQIIKTCDSFYIATATNSDFDNGLTLKIDSFGNIIWTCQYGGYAVVQTNDNNYMVAGGFNYNSAFLRKIDDSGNSLWQKTYGNEGQDDFRFVIQCSDSGIIAGGFSYLPSKNIYVIKTDLAGNTIWEKHFITQGFGWANDAIEHEGYIYIIGTQQGYGVFVAKINQNGYTKWESNFPGYGQSITISHDSNLMIAGNSSLTKISLNGELIWYTLLNEQWNIFAIAPTKDNCYVLSGSAIIGTSYITALIAKIDSVGIPLWHQWYSIPGIPYFNNFESIIVGHDLGYITCGYAEYNSDTKLRIIKTNPDPNVFTSKIEISYDNEINLFPNPTKGKFAASIKEMGIVIVYNISGEKILEQKKGEPIFDLSNYPKGIYYVKIAFQGKIVVKKIILQ